MKIDNIYAQLANLPRGIADNITNAKTGGGRSLNAIHDSKILNSTEKHLMLVMANKLNFTRNFEYQYKDISLNTIADAMSVNRSTVVRIINGYTSRNKKILGLIEKGYIIKHESTMIEQLNGYANHYCLTSKIFDEFMSDMIEEEEARMENEVTHGATPGVCTVQHTIPSIPNSPIYPAVVGKSATAKKIGKPKQEKRAVKKYSSKIKSSWEDKSEIDKMESVLHKAMNAHRAAVERGKAKLYFFDDFPQVLRPIIQEHGVDKVRAFFDWIEGGVDIRRLNWALHRFEQQTTLSD